MRGTELFERIASEGAFRTFDPSVASFLRGYLEPFVALPKPPFVVALGDRVSQALVILKITWRFRNSSCREIVGRPTDHEAHGRQLARNQ